jgi:hypothetical protein
MAVPALEGLGKVTEETSQMNWVWAETGNPDILITKRRNIQFRAVAQSNFFFSLRKN